jgi:hypothetical protein
VSDLASIRVALADALSVLPGVQTSAYSLASPSFPSLCVLGHDEIDYGNLAFGRQDTEWNLIVRGYVSLNFDRAGQERLDRWLADNGPDSVKQAIEYLQPGDIQPSLGGLVEWVLVIRSSGTNIYQLPNQVSALGTDFTVQVQTSN